MTVFVIDDDPFSIFLSRYMLGLESGIKKIKAFASAEEAFSHLTTHGSASYPDLLLVDLNMPIMDGWAFLDAMAGVDEKVIEKCSFYILTSSLEVTDLSRSANYPFVSGVFQKPLSREDMKLILSRLKADEELGEPFRG